MKRTCCYCIWHEDCLDRDCASKLRAESNNASTSQPRSAGKCQAFSGNYFCRPTLKSKLTHISRTIEQPERVSEVFGNQDGAQFVQGARLRPRFQETRSHPQIAPKKVSPAAEHERLSRAEERRQEEESAQAERSRIAREEEEKKNEEEEELPTARKEEEGIKRIDEEKVQADEEATRIARKSEDKKRREQERAEVEERLRIARRKGEEKFEAEELSGIFCEKEKQKKEEEDARIVSEKKAAEEQQTREEKRAREERLRIARNEEMKKQEEEEAACLAREEEEPSIAREEEEKKAGKQEEEGVLAESGTFIHTPDDVDLEDRTNDLDSILVGGLSHIYGARPAGEDSHVDSSSDTVEASHIDGSHGFSEVAPSYSSQMYGIGEASTAIDAVSADTKGNVEKTSEISPVFADEPVDSHDVPEHAADTEDLPQEFGYESQEEVDEEEEQAREDAQLEASTESSQMRVSRTWADVARTGLNPVVEEHRINDERAADVGESLSSQQDVAKIDVAKVSSHGGAGTADRAGPAAIADADSARFQVVQCRNRNNGYFTLQERRQLAVANPPLPPMSLSCQHPAWDRVQGAGRCERHDYLLPYYLFHCRTCFAPYCERCAAKCGRFYR